MKEKILYKVLEKSLKSPFQGFKYEIGKKYHCEDFDEDITMDCSNGFYATDIEGLLYSLNKNKDNRVFECECWGKEVKYDQFKWRHEYIKIIREVSIEEIKQKALKLEEDLGYKLSEALFPINPLLEIRETKVDSNIIQLLKEWDSVLASVWASVGDSVWASVGDSVWDSVWASVGASVGDSVRASVGDSVMAYISSLFPNIKKWKYIEHEIGNNPFQSCIDLWKLGFIPSFDGKTWRLHAGKDAKIVYDITKEELRK
jgi:hypothetical protein